MDGAVESLIGKCGFFCGSCPSYADGACSGCRTAHERGDCFTFDCVDGRKLRYCGQCGRFPCDDIMTKAKATVLDKDWLRWKRAQRGQKL